MNIKKIIAISMALIMLLSAVGCDNDDTLDNTSSNSTSNVTATVPEVTLLYAASDSLNPYKAETSINRQLSSLMYDPLVKLDPEFQPQFCLAKSVDFDKKDCIITLKDAVFSDGTAVTAEDVVYSMKLAMESELTAYKQQLKNVKSYKSTEDGKILVTLAKSDPYFANLLDFPIIKKSTDTLTDENKITLPPIGSGAYIFDTKEKVLSVNTNYSFNAPKVKTVKLINAPDKVVEKYNLEVSKVSIYYTDLADGVIPPMSGNISSVNLNNLVYLGANLDNTFLENSNIRYALAIAVDRTAICNEAYFEYATPATGLFNSAWNDAGSLQNLTKTADLENVVAILEDIGYNSKDDEGFFVNSKGKAITFKLIVNKENPRRLKAAELVKQQLEIAGFKIDLEVLEWNKYVEALTYDNYDLYIAETQLPKNMDVTELVTTGGSLAYGIPALKPAPSTEQKPDVGSSDEKAESNKNKPETGYKKPTDTVVPPSNISSIPLLDKAVKGFYTEDMSLVDIINAFNAETPIIPLCHRQGLVACSSKINSNNMSSVSDAYFGFKNIK